MANEQLFVPKLAADTFNAAQPDPDASLGGLRSSTSVVSIEGEITAVTTDRIFEDAAQISAADLTGSWIYFLDTNLGEIREVVAFDDSTGEITLDLALGTTPVPTDRYWLFRPNSLFASYDAAACRSRARRHRLVYLHNETGSQLDDVVAYVVPIENGPVECRIALGVADYLQAANFDVDDLTDESEVPELSTAAGFQQAVPFLQQFRDPINLGGTWALPFGDRGPIGQAAVPNTRERPIWIQLSFPDDAPIPRAGRAVYAVFIDGGASATVAAILVVVEIDGVSEEVLAQIDRRPRIGGGARVSAQLRDSEAPNEEVPGATISIELASGPGTMAPAGDQVQDPGETIRRVYLSPDDPGQAGATVTFDFEVV